MKRFVYADNAATTRVSETALGAMLPYFSEEYGNPSSLYRLGQAAHKALDRARAEAAAAIGAAQGEFYFTGGGTEADNWALKAVAAQFGHRGKHIITSAVEHHAIVRSLEHLEKNGYEVTWLPVDGEGKVQPETLAAALRPDTILVSIMAANNEVGTLQPIKELCAMAHAAGALFHTDAVQAVGHVPMDVSELGVDLLSLSAHKFHGPKGVGALYVKKGLRILPLIHGGGQEMGRRSGTENVAGAVGLAAALTEAVGQLPAESARLRAMRDRLVEGILSAVPRCRLTGPRKDRLPGLASFVFEGVEGESILLQLDARGVCVSTGSACSSASLDPSHVLLALGIPQEIAHGSIRVSFGAFNTEEDVDTLLEHIPQVIANLRAMSPIWDGKEG